MAMISAELRRLGTDQFLADGDLRDVDKIGIWFALEIQFDCFAEICRRFFARPTETGNVNAQPLCDEVRLLSVQAILHGAHTKSLRQIQVGATPREKKL